VVDIIQTWHELTVWCPECQEDDFRKAANEYKRKYGIDITKEI
jgi:exosome complex RNA-binding protein Csl4